MQWGILPPYGHYSFPFSLCLIVKLLHLGCYLPVIFLSSGCTFLYFPLDQQMLLSGQVNPMCPVSDELEDSSTVCSNSANESSPLFKQKGSPAKQGMHVM